MGEDDALGIPRAAGRVLHEAHGVARDRERRRQPPRAAELLRRHDPVQAGDARAQAGRRGGHVAGRDQHARVGVLENSALAGNVRLDGVLPEGRVDRHRHRAGEQRAEEAGEVRLRGRQHQRHPLLGTDAHRYEVRGDRLRALVQVTIRDRARRPVRQQPDVRPIAVAVDVPLQDLCEGPCRVWPGRQGRIRVAGDALPALDCRAVAIGMDRERIEQRARRAGIERHGIGQGDLEALLEPEQELDAAQAVDAEVVVEPGVERDPAGGRMAELLDQPADQRQQVGLGPCRGCLQLRVLVLGDAHDDRDGFVAPQSA